jgi:hypothetical protein
MKISTTSIFSLPLSLALPFVIAIASILFLPGCGDDNQGKGPAQRAGEATDKAVDKTGEAIKSGAEKSGEVIKEGAQKTGEAVEKTGEKIQDATK